MGKIEKHLMLNEKIQYQTKLSLTIYIKPVIILGVGIYYFSHILALLMIFIGVTWLLATFLDAMVTEVVVTDKRVLKKSGFIVTQSLETMLPKVEGIFVEQGLIGKIFNSGTIIIKGIGGTNNTFKSIDKPFILKAAVSKEIENL